MSSIPSSFLYQPPSEAALKAHYINQKLEDVQTPAAIIDLAAVRKNCDAMLNTVRALNVQSRAHVKTHKTVELAKLQVGPTGPVQLIASTIPEREHLLPWLITSENLGRSINILYGLPASPSSLPRLAKLAHALGNSRDLWPGPIPLFIKIDTGYHRSGTTPSSGQIWPSLLEALNTSITSKICTIIGVYSHLGHSYGYSTPAEALSGLQEEFVGLQEAAKDIFNFMPESDTLTFSVGATPTATATQTLFDNDSAPSPEAESLKKCITSLQEDGRIKLELHAGVYPFLDMQQLATHARSQNLSYENIGLRILVEVASLYPDREKPEALIAAGSLVLGREPCKNYPGWGVVTPWHAPEQNPVVYTEENRSGWIVGRVSQEHGLLVWEGSTSTLRELKIGQKLMVWPNHACVAGSGFGWYLVVDTDSEAGDAIRDVWMRCRGW